MKKVSNILYIIFSVFFIVGSIIILNNICLESNIIINNPKVKNMLINNYMGIEITKEPENIEVKENETAIFNVEAEGSNVKYLWKRSKDNGNTWENAYYEGYTTSEMRVPMKSWVFDYLFYCQITDKDGNTVNTEIVKANRPPVKIVKEPENIEVKENETAIFNVEAEGSNVRYLWKRSKDNGNTWENAYYEGYTTSEMRVPMKSWVFDYLFYCQITDKDGNTVNTEIVKANRPPVKIVKEPENIEVKENETAIFNVEAEGTNIRYLWKRSKDNGNTWENAYYEGYTTSEMRVPMSSWVFDYLFYCQITDKDGNTVNTEIVKANRPPVKIVKEPENIEVKENETAIFNVEAEGTNIRYLWKRSKDNGNTWENAYYEGYTTSEMRVPMKSWVFDYLFYCQITDKDGNTVNTEIVKANRPPVKIVKEPENVEVKENETAIFNVEAEGTNIRYLWKRSKDNGNTWENAYYEGYTTSEMRVPMKSWVFNYLFYCQITDKDGNTINTKTVFANKQEYGICFYNDSSHIYQEQIEGENILSRTETINKFKVNNYSLEYIFENSMNIESKDLLIFRFVIKSDIVNAHVTININENNYLATFPVNTELTEYYLSISNIEVLEKININFETEQQKIYISDIELLNYIDTPVYKLKTGLYNIENMNNTIFFEKDAIADVSTDLIDDDQYLYSILNGNLKIYYCDEDGKLNLVGNLDNLGNTHEMAFSSDKNYLIINSRENGTYFIDIMDKTNPQLVSHYTTLEFATGLCVYENYAFLCSRYHGLEIIDISDIKNPMFVSQVYKNNEEFYDCSVYNGYLYISVWAQMKVEIYDLDNIFQPKNIYTINIDGEGGDILVNDNILYIVTGYHSRNTYKFNYSPGYGMGNGMEIYDISDPYNPIWLSTTKIDGRYRNVGFDHWKIKVSQKYIFFTNIYNGIYIYDVSNLKAPKKVDHIYIYIGRESKKYKNINQGTFILPYDTTDHAQGAVAGMSLVNGKLYFCDLTTGIYIYDKISDMGNEVKDNSTKHIIKNDNQDINIQVDGYNIKKFKNNYSIYAIDKKDQDIYVASGDGGIIILDENLQEINSISTNGAVRDIIVRDDIILSAESENGLSIYKIVDDKIELISNYNTNRYNTCFSQIDINKSNDIVMIQAAFNKLVLLDISNKYEPKLIQEITTGSMYYGNLMNKSLNNNLFAYYDNRGIYVYKEDYNKLDLIFSYNANIISELNGFAYYDNKIILIKDNGYIFFDPTIEDLNISNILTTKIKGKVLRGKPSANNGTMVVSDSFSKQVSIVNVTDLNKPILENQFVVPGSPDIALVDEKDIIIPLRNGGLIKLIKE